MADLMKTVSWFVVRLLEGFIASLTTIINIFSETIKQPSSIVYSKENHTNSTQYSTHATSARKALAIYSDVANNDPTSHPFPIFIGGPNPDSPCESAKFRTLLTKKLKANNFEVYRGEDEYVKEAGSNRCLNAQTHELSFIRERCRAVILIASSAGSFCELGLFSWHYSSAQSSWFLKDYYLSQLAVHDSVQSFRTGRSTIDNAKLHIASKFGIKTQEELNELRGNYGYLNAFKNTMKPSDLARYKAILDQLQ